LLKSKIDYQLIKQLLKKGHNNKQLPLDEHQLEQLATGNARELYDNCEHADLHYGNMKKAYEW
jgi:hypothetical protein